MRRSSSTSHIPIAKGDARARPKSLVRTSSSKKLRPGSTDRLTGPSLQRSNSLSNFSAKKSGLATPTLLGAKSYGGKKSSLATPQMGYGFKRSNSNLTTPASSSRSRSRSPYKIGVDRSANDKEWVSKQSRKLLLFLQGHPNCPEFISEKLRPPITINTFVAVMNLLFKEIHPRMEEINTVNYKDVVLKMLKVFHYPGNVSNSLLKTVNTKHAWSQVVCIFAWLVDLITVIKRADLPLDEGSEHALKAKKLQCVTDYVILKYTLYNNDDPQEAADAEFQEEFAKLLNIDEDEIMRLKEEVTKLSELKETQRKKITEQENKSDRLRKEIDTLHNEIDAFYNNKLERQEELDCKIDLLKTKRENLKRLIQAKRESIASLTDAIQKQTCTLAEKKKMVEHIEALKHTIDLKKEKVRVQKAIKAEYEAQVSAARTELETEVYRLNNSLMKLVLLDPELKILQLKETDFSSPEFERDVQNLIKNIKILETKFADRMAQMRSMMTKINSDNSELDARVRSVKEEIDALSKSESSLKKEIDAIRKNMEQMCKKREEEKQKFAETRAELREKELVVERFKLKFEELTELRDAEAGALETKKKEYLEFFVKLREMTITYVGSLTEIRNQIFDKLKQCVVDIQAHQENLLKDLHELDDIRE